jgi:PA domain
VPDSRESDDVDRADLGRAWPGLLLCVAIGLAAPPAAAAQQFLACETAPIGFDQDNFWTIDDLAGTGNLWGSLADCGQPGNFTGGSGGALCMTTGVVVPPFDAEAVTTSFTLKGATGAVLKLKVNYQDLAGGFDRLDVDLRVNGGAWSNLVSWDANLGTFQGTGVPIQLNLNAFIGMEDIELRFHYYDPTAGNDMGVYAQIDDVEVDCTGGADMQASVGGSATTLIEGQEIHYDYLFTNGGPVAATDVFVLTSVAPGFTLLEVTGLPINATLVGQSASSLTALLPTPLGNGVSIALTARARVGLVPQVALHVSAPQVIAGDFDAAGATFGPEILPGAPLAGPVILAQDGTGEVNDGCEPLTNAAGVQGRIALLIEESACEEDEQVKSAQDAGAIAAIVAGGRSGIFPFGPADDVTPMVSSGSVAEPITIPSIRITEALGEAFKAQVVNGLAVEIAGIETLSQEQTSVAAAGAEQFDPDFNANLLFVGGTPDSDNFAFNNVTVLRDSDGDGVPDVGDGCRTDAAKTSPGICDCGVADTDADGSGIIDCLATEELKLSTGGLLQAVRRLKPLRRGQGKKRRADAQTRKETASVLLATTMAQVAANHSIIVLVDPSADLDALSGNVDRTVPKALKLENRKFRRNKRRATKAVSALRAALGE